MSANTFVGTAGGAIALTITFAAHVEPLPGQGQPALPARFESFVRPAARLPNAESFLYRQDASHYFWTAIELRVLVPDPALVQGFWFANVNRSRSDGLGGFVGSFIRGKIRSEKEKGMQAALRITKMQMEN